MKRVTQDMILNWAIKYQEERKIVMQETAEKAGRHGDLILKGAYENLAEACQMNIDTLKLLYEIETGAEYA